MHDDIVIDYGLQPDEPQPAQQFELCAVADDESTVLHNAFYRYKSLLLIVNYTSATKTRLMVCKGQCTHGLEAHSPDLRC